MYWQFKNARGQTSGYFKNNWLKFKPLYSDSKFHHITNLTSISYVSKHKHKKHAQNKRVLSLVTTRIRKLPTFAGKPTIIGLGRFHFWVRKGIRWSTSSIAPLFWLQSFYETKEGKKILRFRFISTARLNTLRRLHLQPINPVVYRKSWWVLILGLASCLDAFSTYPCPT